MGSASRKIQGDSTSNLIFDGIGSPLEHRAVSQLKNSGKHLFGKGQPWPGSKQSIFLHQNTHRIRRGFHWFPSIETTSHHHLQSTREVMVHIHPSNLILPHPNPHPKVDLWILYPFRIGVSLCHVLWYTQGPIQKCPSLRTTLLATSAVC